ncbi:MAG: ThiF family adenylyltransferase [Sedimentisphaerales bacterium]|nr:ThiF family adenylyltransferase [Sedimentisphaerales bacterium]
MSDSQEKASQSERSDAGFERYSRQMLFGPMGSEGQKRLSRSRVTLIGCGALGSNLADMMVRAGVGHLTIVDRDFVELNNLQRQCLFNEKDIADNLPKAEAAARKLRLINSGVEITPLVADANHESIEYFTDSADLILDGTDNLQTRFLINDVAVKHSIAWVYGACLAATGMAMVIRAGGKPCLRCLIDSPPEAGSLETCETAGVISSVVAWVAAFQFAEALKLLTGNNEAVNSNFVTFDLWENRFHQMGTETLQQGCSCCVGHDFEFLSGKGSLSTISLCGRNSVQIRPRRAGQKINLAELAKRLGEAGAVTYNDFLLRLTVGEREITIFPDSRAIVKGTNKIDEARSLYAKYIGH